MKKKLLVLCTGNSCRSQMAEGYLRHFSTSQLDVYSAGVETHGVNPRAVLSMLNDGIAIDQQTSNHIEEYQAIAFDWVLTVCDHAKERCPILPSTDQKIHVSFPDPAQATGTEEEIMQQFHAVRDQIKAYCKNLVEQLNI